MQLVVGRGVLDDAQRRLEVAGQHHLQRHVRLGEQRLDLRERQRRRAAVGVPAHVGAQCEQCFAAQRGPARGARPAGVAHHGQPGLARPTHVVDPAHRVGERAEAVLGQADAGLGQLPEILFGQRRLDQHRARADPHAAGPVLAEAPLRRDRERLHAGRVAWPSGHVHLAGRHGGRDAAVDVAGEVVDRALPGAVVTERDMPVRVDQPRRDRAAAQVDHLVGSVQLGRQRARAAGRVDQPVPADHGVRVEQRRREIAGEHRYRAGQPERAHASSPQISARCQGKMPRAGLIASAG
ncbi:hypothetical protein [Amycolatopsis panacis]|uniref:hypothetical protein n=1 Tax=Amycolatopsis panacis TaxID=2340917 RepID=UPI0011C37E34|nr:hypothetical protein [Amycolatopsis panacis]